MGRPGEKRRSEDPEDLVAFGKRLRELRLARKLTQEDLAGDRYSAAYVSHLEAGKREPSNETLAYLASRLGLGPEELWTGEDINWVVDMAEGLRRKGVPREAYELLERTLTNLERHGQVSSYVLSVMHRELGLSELEHDPVSAEKHLRQAVDIALQNDGSPRDTAETLAALGDLLEQRGELQEAVAVYRQATELLLRFGVRG